MKNLPRWQRHLLALAAIALVAGATFIVSSAGREDPVLDTVPKDIVEKNDQIIRQFDRGSDRRRGGGILVSPTEIVARDAAVGTVLPVRIVNRSRSRQQLEFDFLPVSRTLAGGAPSIEPNAETRAQGRELVSINASRVTLRPGQAFDVRGVVLKEPAGGVLTGSIGVTIKDPNPRSSDPVRNDVRVTIRNDVRINTMVYLTWPGADDQSVSLQRVRATQDENGELDFVVQVLGGKGVATPRGFVQIRSASGGNIAGAAIENNQRVIPGATRDLVLSRPVEALPSGDYQADAVVISGGARQEVSWPFRIEADGKLPSPGAEVALRLNGVQPDPGSKVQLRAQVRNTGTKNFQAVGNARMLKLGSEEVLGRQEFETGALAPGDIGDETIEFRGPAKPGNYEIVVDISSEDGSRLDQRVISFMVPSDPPPEPGPIDRLRDWMSDNPFGAAGLGIAAFGILAILLVGAIAITGRARRE